MVLSTSKHAGLQALAQPCAEASRDPGIQLALVRQRRCALAVGRLGGHVFSFWRYEEMVRLWQLLNHSRQLLDAWRLRWRLLIYSLSYSKRPGLGEIITLILGLLGIVSLVAAGLKLVNSWPTSVVLIAASVGLLTLVAIIYGYNARVETIFERASRDLYRTLRLNKDLNAGMRVDSAL